ncbi:hypothetical protein HZC00_00155 [Candidatus Kaiserbacteria bacterium]|nr:hypothetical protein [Candidatus Kaiserbacteria bacterium]
MQPTIIGAKSPRITDQVRVVETPRYAPLVPASLTGFAVKLTESEIRTVAEQLDRTDVTAIPLRDIALMEDGALQALHRTLDGFLAKVNAFENPELFKLMDTLKQDIDAEKLPALADKILNNELGMLDKLKGFLNSAKRDEALRRAADEVRQMVKAKTTTLVDKVNRLEVELTAKSRDLDDEVTSLEELKDAYRDHFRDFVVAVAFMEAFLERSRAVVEEKKCAVGTAGDPMSQMEIAELEDKLIALESRTLALTAKMTALPAEQVVIRQLQTAAISTLQETATTASSRFANIKSTLLTLHGALATRDVQRLAASGAALDANLLAVRGKLLQSVVADAANAPAENRRREAEQLRAIADQTIALQKLVSDARANTVQTFTQVRASIAQTQQKLLEAGKEIRPDTSVRR